MAHLYTGRDGFMEYGDRKIAKVTSFSIQGDLELLDATSLRDDVKNYVPGLQSFSGTATILYYRENATDVQPTVDLLNSFLSKGDAGIVDTVKLSFRFVDRNSQGAKQITLDAYITSMSVGASVGEVASAQISFSARSSLSVVVL